MFKAELTLILLFVVFQGLAARSPPVGKRGQCPRGSIWGWRDRAHPVYRSCNDDYDCPGNQKCCGFPRSCRTPIFTRPTPIIPRGCPIPPPFDPDFCSRAFVVSTCQQDSDCGRGEICCITGQCNSKSCVPRRGTVKPTISPVPSGRCPRVEFPLPEICSRIRLSFVCDVDSDCDAGLSCCRTTERCNTGDCISLNPTPRPGQCPIVGDLPDSCLFSKFGPLCQADDECAVGEKCCATERRCGSAECVRVRTPLPPNPRCPAVPAELPDICLVSLFPASDCDTDNDCSGGEICCANECGIKFCGTHPPSLY